MTCKIKDEPVNAVLLLAPLLCWEEAGYDRFCLPCNMADIFSVSFPLAAGIILNFEKVQGWVAQKPTSTNRGLKDNLLFHKICWKNPNFLKQLLGTLGHDFPLIQADLFLNKHTISNKTWQALSTGCRTPPTFLCNLVLHVILFNHGQLQNGSVNVLF